MIKEIFFFTTIKSIIISILYTINYLQYINIEFILYSVFILLLFFTKLLLTLLLWW